MRLIEILPIVAKQAGNEEDYGKTLYRVFSESFPHIKIPEDVDCRTNSQNVGAFIEFACDVVD
jgi:RNA recognition motif-containing protein